MKLETIDRESSASEDFLRVVNADPHDRYEVRITSGAQVFCYNCGSDANGRLVVGFPKTNDGVTVQILPVVPGMTGPPGQEVECRGAEIELRG